MGFLFSLDYFPFVSSLSRRSCHSNGFKRQAEVMKREREEKKHEKNSPSPPQHLLLHSVISNTIIRSGDIDIPLDVNVEILNKLPSKSLVRFRCISKLWSNLVNDITNTRSLTQPSLLVILNDSWLNKSCLHTYPLSSKSKTFLSADEESFDHRETPHLDLGTDFKYVHGLIFCRSKTDQVAIYNPTTNQSVLIPKQYSTVDDALFGYDPVNNQYKVLCFSRGMPRCQVFTLRGSEKLECRRRYIECLGGNLSLVASVCINGIIYYIGGYSRRVLLMRFHIRSELFYHIQTPETLQQMDLELTLVNYQGKLGCICYNSNDSGVEMWIMEDDDGHYWKQVWSKITLFISPPDILLSSLLYESRTFIISGVTRDGEIVIMPKTWSYAETLYAYFHDPKRNETRRVGFETNMKGQLKYRLGVCIFCEPDHFENTMPLFENESWTTKSPKYILSARKKASKSYGIVECSMRLC